MLGRGNGRTRVDDLMMADQQGHRQIHELLGALIDQPATLLEGLIVLAPDRQGSTNRLRTGADRLQRLERLLRNHRADAGLEDARFFLRNLLDRLAQPFRVIKGDRRDDAKGRARDHIGGIETSTKPNLQDQSIRRPFGERQKRGRGGDLEEGCRLPGIDALNFRQVLHKLSFADGTSLTVGTGQFDALMEANEMGRGVDVHALACCLQHRLQVGTHRTLAVRSGDMDHGGQAILRFAEPCQQSLDAPQC